MAAFRGRVHGNFVLLKHGSVPGATLGDSFQAQRRQKRIRPHAERLRASGGTYLDRHCRKFSAGGWLNRNSRSVGALHGSGEDQAEGLTSSPKKSAERRPQTLRLRAALSNAETLRLGLSDAIHLDGAVLSHVASDFYGRTQIFIRVYCILILDR